MMNAKNDDQKNNGRRRTIQRNQRRMNAKNHDQKNNGLGIQYAKNDDM